MRSGLTDAFVAPIADALKVNENLTFVSLALNRVSNQGLADLTQALYLNVTLTRLDVSFNEVTDDGLAVFADVLRSNTVLASVLLASNRITEAGVRSLAEALPGNTSLTELDLSGNTQLDVSRSGSCGAALALLLRNGVALASLSIAGCGIGAVSTLGLAEGIAAHASIRHLALEGNEADPSACALLAASQSLREFKLGSVSAPAAAAFAPLLQREPNTKVTELVMRKRAV